MNHSCQCQSKEAPFHCSRFNRKMGPETYAICRGEFLPEKQAKYLSFWERMRDGHTPQPCEGCDGQPIQYATKLTVGMAVYDDFDRAVFTIQHLRMSEPELAEQIEFVVVDNAPHTRDGQRLRVFVTTKVPNARYVPLPEVVGTTVPRQRVFDYATGPIVVCIDSHVLLAPGSLKKLVDWYAENPDCRDLLQGPMLDDDLRYVHATHMDPVWRDKMFGTWAKDDALCDPAAEPKEIPMHGLGLFACRKEAWPGFPEECRGFGGEEGMIHQKFKQRGDRTLLMPFLQWWHSFADQDRPQKYPNRTDDRVRNYLAWCQHLGLDPAPVIEHFGHETVERAKRGRPAPPVNVAQAPAPVGDGITSTVTTVTVANPDDPQAQAVHQLEHAYNVASQTPSDINQHLPRLRELAEECGHVTEFGIRQGVSTVALLAARPKQYVGYDATLDQSASDRLKGLAVGTETTFHQADTAELETIDETDLLFIDTRHTAEQLTAELKHAGRVRKFIVMHDTEIFGLRGEGHTNAQPVDGLLKAVGEFLHADGRWEMVEHHKHNHGLTVLKRWNPETDASRGLGDTVAKLTHATGIDKAMKMLVGENCGCETRQSLLNRWFGFGVKK